MSIIDHHTHAYIGSIDLGEHEESLYLVQGKYGPSGKDSVWRLCLGERMERDHAQPDDFKAGPVYHPVSWSLDALFSSLIECSLHTPSSYHEAMSDDACYDNFDPLAMAHFSNEHTGLYGLDFMELGYLKNHALSPPFGEPVLSHSLERLVAAALGLWVAKTVMPNGDHTPSSPRFDVLTQDREVLHWLHILSQNQFKDIEDSVLRLQSCLYSPLSDVKLGRRGPLWHHQSRAGYDAEDFKRDVFNNTLPTDRLEDIDIADDGKFEPPMSNRYSPSR